LGRERSPLPFSRAAAGASMNRQVKTIDDIIDGTRAVFQKYGIRKAILFGSFAKGRQTRKSDIDLILIQETDRRYFDRFEGILSDLHQNLRGRDIEVFIYTPKEFEGISDRRFIRQAVAEGQVIYER
jgi:predicted nucleotidyltransferase